MSTTAERNAETSKREVQRFHAVPKGGRFFAYVDERGSASCHGRVTTWTGDTLALIVWKGARYRCPAFGGFGSERQNFRAQDPVTGALWSGTYYCSSGNYCRLRRIQ